MAISMLKVDKRKGRKTATNKPYKNTDITKEDFLEELEKNNGNMYQTYTSMGLPFNRLEKWRKEDADFEEHIKSIKNKTVQWVESQMFKNIEKGDSKMIQFFLNCKADYVSQKKVDTNITTSDTIDVSVALNQIKDQLKD
jgi:hypothetical protein